MQQYYNAYGLTVCADRALPELASSISAPAAPDVFIRRGELGFFPDSVDSVTYRVLSPGDVLVQWAAAGAARVLGGREIQYEKNEESDDLTFRLFLLCQVFGVLLQQRGELVLHASAVEWEGRVAAFAGPPGRGKSTLATAACAAGATLVSDDVLAVRFDQGSGALASPGFAWMRLAAETAALLPPAQRGDDRPVRGTGKNLCDLRASFHSEARPLARVYFVEEGPELEIGPIAPARAFALLCWQTYGRALVPELAGAAVHLRQCAALVNRGRVRQLSRPRDLAALPSLLESIWEDVSQS